MVPGFAILLSSVLLAAGEMPPASAPVPPVPLPTLDALLQVVAARLAAPEVPKFNQTETEEDLDGDNHVTAVRMTKSVQHLLPGNKQHGDVVLAIEDGRDVTDKVREFRAEREEKNHGDRDQPLPIDLEFSLPFEQSQLSHYTFTPIGGTDLEPVVHFEPKEDRHRLWVGDATLDAATGTILHLAGHPAILPMFVDQIDIRMEFVPNGPPGVMPSRVVIEGGAHFLFFHKRMRYTSLVSLPSGAASVFGSKK